MDGTRILGVDPGLNITGYGVLSTDGGRCRLAEAGVVRGGRSLPGGNLAERIQAIHDGICEVLDQCQPAVMALEELYSHYQRPRTAILMGHARGVICLAAASRSVKVIGYSATQVKKILTGSGRAPKNQVQNAVQRELGLAHAPQPNDVADALAIAMCHFYLAGARGVVNATSTHPANSKGHNSVPKPNVADTPDDTPKGLCKKKKHRPTRPAKTTMQKISRRESD